MTNNLFSTLLGASLIHLACGSLCRIGLQTLDKAGKLDFGTCPGRCSVPACARSGLWDGVLSTHSVAVILP